MNNFCLEKCVIHTKEQDVSTLMKMVKPVVDFANKHDVSFDLSINNNTKELISTCEADGRTSAYCKGMVAEMKQMLKDIFHCKLSVLLYAS